MGCSQRHHFDLVSRSNSTVHHANIGDHSAIGVIDRVKNQGPRWSRCITFWRRDSFNDPFQKLGYARTRFGRNFQNISRVTADNVRELGCIFLGLCGREVYLVEHGDDLQVVFHGEVQVRQGLGLNPLSRINQQDGTFTGGQRPRNFIGEVNVPWSVDQVQHIFVAVGSLIGQPDRL